MQEQSRDIGQQFMDFCKADALVSSLAHAQIEHNIVWTQADINHVMQQTRCIFSLDDLQFKYALFTQPEYVMAKNAVSVALDSYDPRDVSARSTLKAITSYRDKLHYEIAQKYPGLVLYASSQQPDYLA